MQVTQFEADIRIAEQLLDVYFEAEAEAFASLDHPAIVYADPDCACTTVYDVLLNSLTELLRDKERHGSCGMGIFETVLRTRDTPYALFLHEFEGTDEDKIVRKLRNIRENYTKPRLENLKQKYPGPQR